MHDIMRSLRSSITDSTSIPPPISVPKLEPHRTTSKQVQQQKLSSATHINFDYKVISQYSQKNLIKLRFSLETSGLLASIRFDQTGNYFAFSDTRAVHVVSAKDGSIKCSMKIPRIKGVSELHPRLARFSGDGHYLAVSCPASSIAIFDLETETELAVLKGHTQIITGLAFSNNSKQLYSSSHDGSLILWDTATLKQIRQVSHGPENQIAAIAVDTYVTVAFVSGKIMVYDETLQIEYSDIEPDQENLFEIMASKAENIFVSGGGDSTAKLWRQEGPKTIFEGTLASHTGAVVSCAFSHKEHFLFTGSKDETICMWDTDKKELVAKVQGHQNTVFEIDHHPSERTFISVSGDGIICVWDYEIP